MLSPEQFIEISKKIRIQIVEMAYRSQLGHIPSSFSLVEILVSLYYDLLHIYKGNINSDDRDRVILSKGHGCMALYAILADLNIIEEKDLIEFGTMYGILGGHPSRRKIPGIELSTGSLGHGPAYGVGTALSLKKKGVLANVCVVMGDGECNEGSVWEAALSASKHQLDNYWLIIDHNKYQSYGKNKDICPLLSLYDKFSSFGLTCFECDMVTNPYGFLEIFNQSRNIVGPKCIICHGIKGLGAKSLEGNLQYHHLRAMTKEFKQQLIREITGAYNMSK